MASSNITVTVATSNVAVSNDQTNVTVSSAISNVTVSNTAVVTNADIRSALSGGYGITYSNVSGVIQTANSDVTALSSVTNAGGDGSLSYVGSTGVFTYTGPSATETRAHFSATAPITLASGVIGINANALFSGKTTDDLTEGSTNLYYTNARVNAYIIDNGLDFNAEKVDDRVADLMVAGANLTYTYDDAANSLTLTQQLKTQDITEGTNLYFTDSRVHNAIAEVTDNGTVAGNITLDLASNITHSANISGNITNISFTNTPSTGYQATVILTQDSSGGHVIDPTYFSNWEFTDNYKTFDTSPGDQNIVTVLNDGSTTYASVVGFKSSNFTTDSVPEGSTNLYYTNARANSAIQDQLDSYTSIISSSANVTTTANVSGAFILGDGSQLTNMPQTLTNAQVISHIATGPLSVGGNLSVTGNIDATGNINYQNVTDLYVTDQKITLNANATTDATVEIISNRPQSTHNAIISWNEPSEKWTFMNGDNVYQDILTTTQVITESRGSISTATPASASGGGALAYNSSTGAFTFTPSVPGIQLNALSVSTGSASGSGSLAYDNSNGQFAFAPADLSSLISLSALSTTTASASGGGSLAYDNSSGVFTFAPAEVRTDPQIRGLLSTTTATASGGGSLAYDNSSGVFTFAPADDTAGVVAITNDTSTNATVYPVFSPASSGDNALKVSDSKLYFNVASGDFNIAGKVSASELINTTAVTSSAGSSLQLKGQTDGIKLNTTLSSVESKLFDIDTTGYSVADADLASQNITTVNTPQILCVLAFTSGSTTATVTPLFAGLGMYIGIQQVGGGFGDFNSAYVVGDSSLENALTTSGNNWNGGATPSQIWDGSGKLAGWGIYDVTTASSTTYMSAAGHIASISGNNVTLSEAALATGGGACLLIPGAFSSTQNFGMRITADTATTGLPYGYAQTAYNAYDLPETLSNVTLDRVSYGNTSTVDMANVVMRHSADIQTGPDSAIRIPRAMLIGANATPDLLSVGTNTLFPATSTLGITVEQDGLTNYGPVETIPQMKVMFNNYKTGSLASQTAYPNWSQFLGQGGNATVDMKFLGAPNFNFKLLGGTKDAIASTSPGDIPGRITWNPSITTGSSGADQFNPPASITAMIGGVGDPTTLANTDVYLQSTSPNSFRSGPLYGTLQGSAVGGSIPTTFLASKSGTTTIAPGPFGKISLRPARDYADSGSATTYVANRYANELHEYHEFLGAGWGNTIARTGTLVEIQPKSGQTNGVTPGASDFNYDSKGDSTLRIKTHNANSTVKSSWDITNSQSTGKLSIVNSINESSLATAVTIDSAKTEFNQRIRLQNLTTTEINALVGPADGDMVYNTTLDKVCVYSGSTDGWQQVSSTAM